MKKNAQTTKFLLACGMLAGPFYILVGLAQILFREGFDMTKHPLSMLSLGDLGWIQIANFLITGVLVILGAMGLRRTLTADKRGKRMALFLTIYGICILGGGVFVTDPSLGFPPGTPDTFPETFSWHALIHFISSQLGLLALIIATFVGARYFGAVKQQSWAVFSTFTGFFFLASMIGFMAGTGTAWGSILLYVAIAWGWVWLTAVSAHARATAK